MGDLWTDYWHLVVAGLFALASLGALHYGKEEKAKRSQQKLQEKIDSVVQESVTKTTEEMKKQFGEILSEVKTSSGASIGAIERAAEKITGDVELATNDLKNETKKLTNALNYSTLILQLSFKTPGIEEDIIDLGLAEDLEVRKHQKVPKYLAENFRAELFIKDDATKKGSFKYELSSEEFEFAASTVGLKNGIWASPMLKGSRFSMNFKFELVGPLNINIEKFKKEGNLWLVFIEKKGVTNKKMRKYLTEKMKLSSSSMRFIKEDEWSQVHLVTYSPAQIINDGLYTNRFHFILKAEDN